MAEPHEVSHGDIYHKLGALEGKLDAVIASVGEKRTDLNEAFLRIRELERSFAKWAGIALAASIVIPLLVTAAAPRLHFLSAPATTSRPG
tara:strand:- start:317 stop:586 length:270 start_codon:yes stop_codon:yes gene_type:complete